MAGQMGAAAAPVGGRLDQALVLRQGLAGRSGLAGRGRAGRAGLVGIQVKIAERGAGRALPSPPQQPRHRPRAVRGRAAGARTASLFTG